MYVDTYFFFLLQKKKKKKNIARCIYVFLLLNIRFVNGKFNDQ